jgi:hypothetical protein
MSARVYKMIARRIREHQAAGMGNGWGEAWLESPAFAMVAAGLLEFMIKKGGVNYVEVPFQELKTGRQIVVTCQYVDGKTPAMLRNEAEAERDALKDRVAELETMNAAQAWDNVAANDRVAEPEAAAQLRPMDQAPRDKSVLAQLLPPYHGWDVISHLGYPWGDNCWSGARGIITEEFIAGWMPLPTMEAP